MISSEIDEDEEAETAEYPQQITACYLYLDHRFIKPVSSSNVLYVSHKIRHRYLPGEITR